MSQDVRQWLAEIKLLQQKLAAAQQERDEAYASAANWRNLYEKEAKQRRTEAAMARQTIESLNAEIHQLRSVPSLPEEPVEVETIRQEVAQIAGIDHLKAALLQARIESDRYAHALKVEQTAHIQTRKALTTALGDTMDSLARERTVRKKAQAAAAKPATATNGSKPGSNGSTAASPKKLDLAKAETRTPSLELPQFESEQCPS